MDKSYVTPDQPRLDFTLTTYQKLLQALLDHGFTFQPFADYLERPEESAVILRHDVDKLPGNALQMAQLEHSLGIQGSYYFRVVKESWNEDTIRQIAGMGHEIGYHYEDLSLCRGNHGEAIRHFEEQLKRFWEIVDVKTICMHGSPLSKHDNRDLWKEYNYRDYDIIGEPYFDLDFSRVFYLTDTGRRWDGGKVSVRDKVVRSKQDEVRSKEEEGALKIRSTKDIIRAVEARRLPSPLMITIHPQRWTNKPLPWLHELLWQNTKNVIKKHLIRIQQGQNHKQTNQ